MPPVRPGVAGLAFIGAGDGWVLVYDVNTNVNDNDNDNADVKAIAPGSGPAELAHSLKALAAESDHSDTARAAD